ncbi:hypothetical protein ACF3DV_13510 [Chlorogloeopsis fritschii PCC 9212]|nr:hypothetical protein [Chlorogloeopsis fritschii]
MERHRIMVIGSNVRTVQRVSSYCLKKSLEVFPYYGIPNNEEVTLFAPHVFVLCLPILGDFRIFQPYILWSEQPTDEDLSLVTTPTELYTRLQEFLSYY